MSISLAISALITRMDEHPEEFIPEDLDLITYKGDYFYRTRWEAVSKLFVNPDPLNLFTSEERDAYKNKLQQILRAKIDEKIIREIIGREYAQELAYRDKQIPLPLVGGAPC